MMHDMVTTRRQDYIMHRERARALVHERIAYWCQHYPFSYGDVRIKNHRSVWGSCSTLQNLNFNYRIAHVPSHLADYIVLHELCHTVEMNHSVRFWGLVAQFLPEWRKLRSELRKVSLSR